jgi:hypothetical protein
MLSEIPQELASYYQLSEDTSWKVEEMQAEITACVGKHH